VCLQHCTLENRLFAFCIKATSKTTAYANNPKRLAGVVFYRAGVISFFEKDTVIEPDNQFPIPHYDLIRQHSNASGDVRLLGALPSDFPAALAKAVRDSVTMPPSKKKRLLLILGL